jgi:peroxiredoxin
MLLTRKWIGICCIVIFIACEQKDTNEFTIKGTIKNATKDVIFLEEAPLGSSQPMIVDSAIVEKDGKFELSALAKEENLYVLRLSQQVNPIATLINDSKEITVEIDVANVQKPYSVKGSSATNTLVEYISKSNEQLSKIYSLAVQIDSMRQKGTPDSLMRNTLFQHQQEATAFRSYAEKVMNESKSPTLSIFTLGSYQSYASNPGLGLQPLTREELKAVVDRTAKKHPEHIGLANIKTSMESTTPQQNTAGSALLNKPAPDFTLPDVNGKPVSLSSFKGKYVLVDFWASWCAPCRAENPNVVKAFQQFKNKNFTILGVSLDKEKGPWTKAISDDQLTWTNISDLKFWDSQVVPMYGIQGIPYNVLLDPNGIVIAENLRGEELERKLADILK